MEMILNKYEKYNKDPSRAEDVAELVIVVLP